MAHRNSLKIYFTYIKQSQSFIKGVFTGEMNSARWTLLDTCRRFKRSMEIKRQPLHDALRTCEHLTKFGHFDEDQKART